MSTFFAPVVGTADLANTCGVSTQTLKGWLHRNEIPGLDLSSSPGRGVRRSFSEQDSFRIILFAQIAQIGSCNFANKCLKGFEVPSKSAQFISFCDIDDISLRANAASIWQKVALLAREEEGVT